MIQFIFMLLGLAFSHQNAQILTGNNDNKGQLTTQGSDRGVDPDGPGNGGSTGGNTGQTPPPFTNP